MNDRKDYGMEFLKSIIAMMYIHEIIVSDRKLRGLMKAWKIEKTEVRTLFDSENNWIDLA